MWSHITGTLILSRGWSSGQQLLTTALLLNLLRCGGVRIRLARVGPGAANSRGTGWWQKRSEQRESQVLRERGLTLAQPCFPSLHLRIARALWITPRKPSEKQHKM